MLLRRLATPGLLLLLSAALGVGLFLTRDRGTPADPGAGDAAGAATAAASRAAPAAGPARPGQPPQRRERPFDNTPLLTARRLAALAEGPEEAELARQAQRLADHVVDLAFADTLQAILETPPPATPEIAALTQARTRAQAAVGEAAARVDALAKEAEAAPEDEDVAQHLELARAQVELARDELEGAEERLARAGGDPQARIQRLRAAYQGGQKGAAEAPAMPSAGVAGATPDAAAVTPAAEGSLLARLRAYLRVRGRMGALEEARQLALARVERLEKRGDQVRKRVEAAEARGAAPAEADEAARAEALRALARDRRRVTSIGRRLQDHQDLAALYGDWESTVDGKARAALHRLLLGAAWVLLILALTWAAGLAVERAFHRADPDALRAGTLRGVVKLAVQLLGALVAVFVVLGVPGQATTILGLAGAGLTVALKDFIVAFFGWFVLMGRNGIRVGDWVEVKGVGGEVAEIGLIHTVLLETGSWSDAGHPTGRRVSFVNSFAIEGHYFNFTTSGQWMWDALQVLVPMGQDPYPVIDGIQKLVERETDANARQAEQEWQKTTSRYRVRTFSAVPGINVVPTSNGVQLDVRYITRAHERHETRRRLYGAVVELMHGRRERAAG